MINKKLILILLCLQTTARTMANISPADRIKGEKESVWLVLN